MPHRLALAVALAVAVPAAAQTTPGEAKGSITVDAQSIEGVGDLEVTARGNAEIRRGEVTIFGEVLRYNREFGRVDGEGGVRLQLGADRFFGPRLQYDTLEDTGTFEQPKFLLQRDREARGGAEQLEFLGRERYRLKNATVTTCRPGQDDWQLEARELDLDYAEDEGEARGLRLRFFDTTIIGSPWASFPLENRRRSGLLTPYYSQTTTRGLELGIPYYWNIAPERDATLTPVYMAKRGFQLKNSLRYLDRDYAGELRLEYLPDDRVFRGSRDGISLQHSHSFLPGLKGQVDFNQVSDDRYFVDLATQVKQVTIGNLPQDANLTYTGAFGEAPYALQARLHRFQTLQDPLNPITPPYHRLPQIKFNGGAYGMAGFFDSTLPAEYVRFAHPTLTPQAARFSMTPSLAGAFVAPGWFFTPKVGVRYAQYGFDRAAPGQPQSTQLTIPWLSMDSGVVLERGARWFGEHLTQTLEPRLFYLYVPYRAQDHIPVFDTARADFNYPQLFTENRFVGGDRFGDANQLTLALSSRFLQADGQEVFRGTVGQRYYLRDERVGFAAPNVPASETLPPRTSIDSTVLAALGGRLYRHWNFDATTEYDRHEGTTERYTLGLRYTPELAKVVNFKYRFNRAAIKQLDLSTQWPLQPGWYGVGRYNYSLLDKRLLEGLAGIEYNAGCWVFRAVLQRVQAATRVTSTAFVLQLELNGVGQLGTGEAVDLLKRSVPGYSATNPGDQTLAPPSARPRAPFEQVF